MSTDLRIVNGRLGYDANIGNFTFLSNLGKSVIDYAILSQDLFPLVSNFIVHDLHTFSHHKPVQLNFNFKCNHNYTVKDCTNVDVLKQDNDDREKLFVYKQSIENEILNIDFIVNSIINNNMELNTGIEQITEVLYRKTFNIFGETKCIKKITNLNVKVNMKVSGIIKSVRLLDES